MQLKATPTVVRKVFDDLTTVGILERRPRSGTYIRNISTKEFLDSSLVRAWLEALAAKLACQQLTEDQFQQLEKLADQLDAENEEPATNPALYVELEIAFHTLIVEASGNTVLQELAQRHHFITRYIEQHARIGVVLPTSTWKHPSHRDLVATLRKRQPEIAQQAMYRHVLVSTRGLVDLELPN